MHHLALLTNHSQFVMEEYHSMNPGSFWAKWSKGGKRMSVTDILMSVTDILTGLKESRRQENAILVRRAQAEFDPNDFSQNFGYRKGSMHMTCHMDHTVACYYRAIEKFTRGLPT
jgi:hypothetical protein